MEMRQRTEAGRRRRRSRFARPPAAAVCLALMGVAASVAAAATLTGDVAFNFQASSDVSSLMKLALDVKTMRSSDMEEKKKVYETGNGKMSLQSLSLEAKDKWSDVPIFRIYTEEFLRLGADHESDAVGLFDGKPVEQYADTLVLDLFALNIDRIEGTGAVVLNVLMAYWGYLWRVLTECWADNAVGANAALDSAFALWVGEGQVRSDNRQYFMYSIAEDAGFHFGQDSGESKVNAETITRLLSLQGKINRGECSKLDETYVGMRNDVKTLMRQSNIVLAQMLLHHVLEVVNSNGKSDFAELYALALAPQIAACHTGLYTNLTDLTVTHDVTVRTLDASVDVIYQSLSCLGVSCSDMGTYSSSGTTPSCLDPNVDSTAPLPRLARYQPLSDVRRLSTIDRDIRQMRIFMQHNMWEAAEDYFVYGWNSDECSLQDIANGIPAWTDSPDFDVYTQYYDDDEASVYGFGVDLVSNALLGINGASQLERQGVVLGTLEFYVMHLGIMGQIWASLIACDETNGKLAIFHWDSAVALLIGSTEGGAPGGQAGGQSIYSVSKKFCQAFSMCEPPSSSIVDTVLVASFEAGAKHVHSGTCQEARTIVDEKIRPFLLVTMIQGVLFYAAEAAMNPGSDAKGFLIAYTLALLPHNTNAETAKSLKAIIAPTGTVSVPDTFQAIRGSLVDLGVECGLVGKMLIDGKSVGVCESDQIPDHPIVVTTKVPSNAPTLSPVGALSSADIEDVLEWGRYNFTYKKVALNDSLFSLDVRDMYFSSTPSDAETVYATASTNALNGLSRQPRVRSLKDFSTKASFFMQGDPVYNFYRLALFEDETFEFNFTGADGAWAFGDDVVELAVGPDNGDNSQLASKAAVVLNIWTTITHKLYEAVRTCSSGANADEFIDSAVGLWIGQDQAQSKFNSGWSMYSIAQEAVQRYRGAEKESKVNTDLMTSFNEAQKIAKSCKTNVNSTFALRPVVDEIVRLLSVPLLQHLLFHMSDNNFQYVELYALAFIPQTISVDEGAYGYLRDSLFEGFKWDKTVTPDFVAALGKVLQAMRFSCADLGDTTNSTEILRGFVDVLCEGIEIGFNSSRVAAYETSFDVNELARLDLDALQIDLLMRANAYPLALSIYKEGRNSRSGNDALYSLQGLATRAPNDELVMLHQSYFDEQDSKFYADDLIVETLKNSSDFADYSRRQKSENVRRTLQIMVVYLEVVARAREAVAVCNGNGKMAGQEQLDQAVALYVGSIEGPFSGGNPYGLDGSFSGGNPYGLDGSGQMLYALAKEMCRPFSRCEAHDDADANVFLLFAFSQMKENLDVQDCAGAKSILDNSILTVLPVPIFQGILFFADLNEGTPPGSSSVSLVAQEVLIETLLPQIDGYDEATAAFLRENLDFFDEEAVKNGTNAVFSAVASILDAMGVDCDAIGSLSVNKSLCVDAKVSPSSNTITNLLDDVYVATTYVQDRANIAFDVKEMQEALALGHPRMAEAIYTDGRNSDIYDKEGREVDLRSLASFSKNASFTMKTNPMFQITVYGLRDDRGNYLGNDAAIYADSIVKEMLSMGLETKEPLAAEAAVALNLWMELTNELFHIVAKCKNKSISGTDGIREIDEAVAYWIGDGQANGHLLYALAEKMGTHFNGNSTEIHSRTNSNILRLFNQAKVEISLPNACAENPVTARRMRHIVEKIMSLMVVVNIQSLIHYLLEDDEQHRVRIYAHAFVPLIAGCSPQTYKFLKEKLIDASYRVVDVEFIISEIRSTLSCLSIKCDDVGFHASEMRSVCSDPSPLTSMADYSPANDVQEFAQLDLDTLELDILMQMGAYDAAEELYTYGKHSAMGSDGDGTALSLEYLATTSSRSVVPQFEAYQKHFGMDGKYADTMIRSAFNTDVEMTEIQRREVVVGTSQYTVIYMAALQAMHETIGSCKSTNGDKSISLTKSWDKVAALLIGHLEGSREGGSSEGRFLWALSKKYCSEFNTCSKGANSTETNDKIVTLLYAGRGAVVGGSCDELRKATNDLTPLLLVPLLQASLSAAIKLSKRNPFNKEMIQAAAYVYTQTLLPLIENVSSEAAKVIRKNFPLDGQAIEGGVVLVAETFASVMAGLGVDCRDVGKNDSVDPCTGRITRTRKEKLTIAVGCILGLLSLFGIMILLRSKLKPVKSEDAPVFVASKGELNHSSEVTCSRSSASISPKDSDEETYRLNDASDTADSETLQNDDDEYVRAISDALQDERAHIV